MKSSHNFVAPAALALAAFAAAALASSSQATGPSRNGRIAYMVKDTRDHWQIWVANSDLTGAQKLTHGRSNSGWPVWSPDGKRLVFDSDRTDHTPNDAHHVNDVFAMNADGTGVEKLTSSKGVSENAAWSPNGSLIAFDHGKRLYRTAIYVMRPNGRKLRKVTAPRRSLNDYAPRFSPDGGRLVFTRKRGLADHAPAAIFTVRLDGSRLRRLTPFSMRVGQADWSPDGTQIVFDASPNPKGNGDVYVMNATGGKAVNLTKNPLTTAGSDSAVWSPDGHKILFVDNRFVNGVGTTGLATMNPDGSNRQFLASRSVDAGEPDWQSIGAASARQLASAQSKVRTGPLTLFFNGPNGVAHIVTAGHGKHTSLWHCPTAAWCGEPVSFAWAPDGRHVAFTLDEIGGDSPYVGLHVVNVVSKQDRRIPGGAPQVKSTNDDPDAWRTYLKKTESRVGCWPAANLAWSADGSRLAYNCGAQLDVLKLHGSGYATVPTDSGAFWPSWSPSGTRIAYSTQLKPLKSAVYTVALDGSHRRLIASRGAAPAWSPDGRTIAYQTRCGIRLVTPSGRAVYPGVTLLTCGAGSQAGPPVWSPDGTKLAFDTADEGVWVVDRNGRRLRSLGFRWSTTTWYGGLPERPSWRAVP